MSSFFKPQPMNFGNLGLNQQFQLILLILYSIVKDNLDKNDKKNKIIRTPLLNTISVSLFAFILED